MTNISHGPFARTEKNKNTRAAEWLVALTPVMLWSIYMFGARVITICAISGLLALLLDYCLRRFLIKAEKGDCIDVMSCIYGILAAFMMPVAVPLWIPMISALLVVIAKNIRVFRKKRLFNPFVFSAAVLNLCFKTQMTAFTRPFAYFSAFSFSIDERLLQGYRVTSPLQFMADGSVYEDGILAQFYGFASGNIGEIAVCAMILSLIWLCARKEGDWASTVAFLIPLFLFALLMPSGDAESEHYAYSMTLVGATVFLSVFAVNERHTVPMTRMGRIIFGGVCGVATFFLHKYYGGFEWGYFAVLGMNILSPFIEMITKPKITNQPESEKVK